MSAKTLRRALDDFLKHFDGIIILRLPQIERPQKIVPTPVTRTPQHHLLIGVLRFLRLAEALVRTAEANQRVFICRLKLCGALELINCFFILSCPAGDHTQAHVAGSA